MRCEPGHSFSKRGGGNKIGEQVVAPTVTIASDPWDPDLLASPFAGDGLPNKQITWIESGVVRNLLYDRYWASQKNVERLENRARRNGRRQR